MHCGRVQADKVLMKFVYPNANSTEIRSRLTLRSTVRGANNRLDMLSIVSYDRLDGTASSLAGARCGLRQSGMPCYPAFRAASIVQICTYQHAVSFGAVYGLGRLLDSKVSNTPQIHMWPVTSNAVMCKRCPQYAM